MIVNLKNINRITKDNSKKDIINIRNYDPKIHMANAIYKAVYITNQDGEKCIVMVYTDEDYYELIRDLFEWHGGDDTGAKTWSVFQEGDIAVEDVQLALGTTIALKYSCYLNSKLRDDIDNRWLFISFKIKKLFRCFGVLEHIEYNDIQLNKKEWEKKMEAMVDEHERIIEEQG